MIKAGGDCGLLYAGRLPARCGLPVIEGEMYCCANGLTDRDIESVRW